MSFQGVNFEFTVDTVLLMVIFNVVLTGMHWVLYWVHEKKWGQWSDGPLKAITFLMSMLSIVLGNMKHPPKPREPHG
jgi:hypothetical protein